MHTSYVSAHFDSTFAKKASADADGRRKAPTFAEKASADVDGGCCFRKLKRRSSIFP